TLRMHWTERRAASKIAHLALWSALRAAAVAHSTQTTLPGAAKICWTACDTLDVYLATRVGVYPCALIKRGSGRAQKKPRRLSTSITVINNGGRLKGRLIK